MKKISKILLSTGLITLLNGCGVEVHSDSPSQEEPYQVEYLRYTLLDTSYRGDADVVSSDCIDVFDRHSGGSIDIDNLRTGENFRFTWDNLPESVVFQLKEDGSTMVDTSYAHNYFTNNSVSQEVITSYGTEYTLLIEEDPYCY